MRAMTQRGVLAGLVGVLVIGSLARPSAADDDDLRRADALFAEGRALIDTDFAKACAKFEASLQISAHAIGTLLNVALCDEKLGRFASAVARFREARDRAQELGMSAELAAAEEHLGALEGKVPHVTLRFDEPPLPDTKIVIDDALIPFGSIANHPIDPGAHEVVISAPGHLAFTARFEVGAGQTRDVAIPRLERSVTVKSSRRTIGTITTATGVAALGAGIVVGLVARGRHRDAKRGHCNTITTPDGDQLQCDQTGFTEIERARTLGGVGSVIGAVGIGAIGVGVFLWLSAPSSTAEQPRVSRVPDVVPYLGAGEAGILAVGRF